MYEFLAAVSFARKDGLYADDNLTFCLGEERRSLSLAYFSLRVGIYLPAEIHTPVYQQFIAASIRSIKGFKEKDHWHSIANGVYHKGTAQESDMQSPIHRLLHRLITNTINERREGDKCPTVDVFFLWVLTSSEVYAFTFSPG